MKRSCLLGRSLAVTPLLVGLALGSSGPAAAAIPTPAHAVEAHAVHQNKVLHKTLHKRAVHKAKKTHKSTRVAAKTTDSSTVPTTATPVAAPVTLTAFEARLVVLVNQARSAHGLAQLTVVAGATDVARRWALALAGDDALSHNPLITEDMQAAGSPDWTFLAENVGSADAGDADGLFAAYMASPHHRENILDPRAIEIGMGAVTTPEPEGDTTWNTMDFVDSYDPSYGQPRTNPIAAELPLADLTAALL